MSNKDPIRIGEPWPVIYQYSIQLSAHAKKILIIRFREATGTKTCYSQQKLITHLYDKLLVDKTLRKQVSSIGMAGTKMYVSITMKNIGYAGAVQCITEVRKALSMYIHHGL